VTLVLRHTVEIEAGYLSKKQASLYLSLSVRSIEKRLSEIPHFRVGNKILFKKSQLDTWMDSHREPNIDISKLADDIVKDILGRN
jgi:excisionase family DNA binding protein